MKWNFRAPLQQALDKLEKWVDLIILPFFLDNHDSQQCDELIRRNTLWRFLHQGVDQNDLSAIKRDLQNAVEQFESKAYSVWSYFIEILAVLYWNPLRRTHNFSNILTCGLLVKL